MFCHNDFSTHNVIVNPSTLKVNAIIDWEYAGFYPVEFEGLSFDGQGRPWRWKARWMTQMSWCT